MSQTRILALVGSLRAASINRQLAEAAAQNAPEGVAVSIYEGLGEIPFYNEDIDVAGRVPAAAAAVRAAVADADALVLFVPEYNGTIPAALKNVIDWVSRPYGTGALKGKPVAVISASISANAAKWAHADTVKALGVAGAAVVEDATVHFGGIGTRFAEAHPSKDAEALAELAGALRALISTIEIAAA
ncbi:NAD(P)H-dependent oxidoreductase [Nocardia sp. alder85J]|uniref:NAD(P)H-dependent oxidoreductase n=1 Tax=Nocardia sp. alder85J TaxID=2862949 RepID=UPI001CD28A82|nr:NAD(P)H-dependent oxidoreductase [Nocardia sp. alder85J]MCX4095325.1 NAD(P)H-dependent oxidoreductase [Nocardia sp. alder85J]